MFGIVSNDVNMMAMRTYYGMLKLSGVTSVLISTTLGPFPVFIISLTHSVHYCWGLFSYSFCKLTTDTPPLLGSDQSLSSESFE